MARATFLLVLFIALWSGHETSKVKDPATIIKLNKAIDLVMDTARFIFTKDGEISVKLPDINAPFGKGIMRGTFKASGGSFRNLATLHRTGDVDAFKNGSSVGVFASFGLYQVDASYSNYSLDILKIHQSGNIDAQINDNSFSLKLTLTYSPKCSFKMNYVRFDKLAGVKINITGLGAFQPFFNELSSWLIENFEPSFKTIVNDKLSDKLNKAMAKADVCKYIPII